MTRNEAKAVIYNMSAEILLDKATEEKIKAVVESAKKHNLLPLVAQEFGDITKLLT